MRNSKRTKNVTRGKPQPTKKVVPSTPTLVSSPPASGDNGKVITIPPTVTVKALAEVMSVSPIEVIKELMKNGVMATINQVVDYDAAALVATNLGFAPQKAKKEPIAAEGKGQTHFRFVEEDSAGQRPRPPIVTIMGHVDHGKTSLLDAIRQTNVTAREAGSITQHIGAYQVEVDGQKITFLDTPGHEAFTAMRARGAKATDIAVLVVAADDGVMPQTVEAIDHAKAAGVPIVVAISKIDRPEANVERVKRELAEHGLVIEEWGGDVICVPISSKTKQGIPDLLENLLLVAEVSELRANPNRPAAGVVIEAQLDKTKGSLVTALIQTGTLREGDVVVAGDTMGRVKAMFDDRGRRVKRAAPGTPVAVLGMNGVPQAGDTLMIYTDERRARQVLLERQRAQEAISGSPTKVMSLDDLFDRVQAGQVKELNVVLKTDVQGSIEPIRDSLEKLGSENLKVKVIHAGSGSITESDVLLAVASKGIVLGFNSRPELGARRLADGQGVDIRFYDVIYNLVEDVERALKGLVEPTYAEVVEGHAEVRATFPIGRHGMVAGVYVTDGKISRGGLIRILRSGQVIYDSRPSSLRHFKEDVREMSAGFECGVGIEGFNEFQPGDIVEAYRKERVEPPAA